MTWLIWRQHRQQAFFGLATFALISLVLVLTGSHMHTVFRSSGLGHCLATRSHADCGDLEGAFESRYATLRQLVPFFMVLPALLGIFWGAPLIAREVEQGTHLFAWTQGVTRLRWLGSKLFALLALTLLLTTAYALLISWWLTPLDRSTGDRFQLGIFDQQGIVPVAYALFALALGIAAGAVLKKTMPAMAATLVGFVGLRLIVAGIARRHFVSPVTKKYVPLPASTRTIPVPGSSAKRRSTARGIRSRNSRSAARVRRRRRARRRASTAACARTASLLPTSSSRPTASGSSRASKQRSSQDSRSACSPSQSGGSAGA